MHNENNRNKQWDSQTAPQTEYLHAIALAVEIIATILMEIIATVILYGPTFLIVYFATTTISSCVRNGF
jgi:hypothetical protein